jgi:hypothetical protein
VVEQDGLLRIGVGKSVLDTYLNVSAESSRLSAIWVEHPTTRVASALPESGIGDYPVGGIMAGRKWWLILALPLTWAALLTA